jgi:hypothetical protein
MISQREAEKKILFILMTSKALKFLFNFLSASLLLGVEIRKECFFNVQSETVVISVQFFSP